MNVLHTVRTLGYAGTPRIARRAGLAESQARQQLREAAGHGWLTGDDTGWSMTEAGKRHGEALLAAELARTGARAAVEQVHEDFLPLNATVTAACTAWQLSDLGIGPKPSGTIEEFARVAGELRRLESRLTAHLPRFAGYHDLFSAALTNAATDPAWLAAIDRDSCHRVWFELHEDLIATLGLTR